MSKGRPRKLNQMDQFHRAMTKGSADFSRKEQSEEYQIVHPNAPEFHLTVPKSNNLPPPKIPVDMPFPKKSRTKKQKETNYNPYQDYFTACKSRNTLTRGSKTRPNFNDKYATGLKYSSLFSENLMHSLDMTYSIQDSDFSLTRDLCINSSDEVIFECKSKMMESLKKKAREIKRDSKRKKNKYARDIATNSKSKKTISVVEFMRNLNKNQIHHYCYMLSKNGDFLKKSSSVNLVRKQAVLCCCALGNLNYCCKIPNCPTRVLISSINNTFGSKNHKSISLKRKTTTLSSTVKKGDRANMRPTLYHPSEMILESSDSDNSLSSSFKDSSEEEAVDKESVEDRKILDKLIKSQNSKLKNQFKLIKREAKDLEDIRLLRSSFLKEKENLEISMKKNYQRQKVINSILETCKPYFVEPRYLRIRRKLARMGISSTPEP
ncbi:unnamed protein product [Moneuplotes crassus]|uniref:Uncharacterized protein n=1 Tax=Euplotes crassus TaxID=5936 RepID=A0AAD1Y5Z2_EUPCR|nr:unnamed protein product [Moneuplotes crassus]